MRLLGDAAAQGEKRGLSGVGPPTARMAGGREPPGPASGGNRLRQGTNLALRPLFEGGFGVSESAGTGRGLSAEYREHLARRDPRLPRAAVRGP